MSEELQVLKSIDFKLDQLILLMKMSNREKLNEVKRQLQGDIEYARILEICAQPTSYGEVVTQVVSATGVSERTAQSKVAQLRELGVLVASRHGRETYYVDSGLVG